MIYILLGVHYFKHKEESQWSFSNQLRRFSVYTNSLCPDATIKQGPFKFKVQQQFWGLCYLMSLNTLTYKKAGRAVSQSQQVTWYVTVLCVSHYFLTSLFPGQRSRDYEDSSGHPWSFFRNNFTHVCTIDGFCEAQHSWQVLGKAFWAIAHLSSDCKSFCHTPKH